MMDKEPCMQVALYIRSTIATRTTRKIGKFPMSSAMIVKTYCTFIYYNRYNYIVFVRVCVRIVFLSTTRLRFYFREFIECLYRKSNN